MPQTQNDTISQPTSKGMTSKDKKKLAHHQERQKGQSVIRQALDEVAASERPEADEQREVNVQSTLGKTSFVSVSEDKPKSQNVAEKAA